MATTRQKKVAKLVVDNLTLDKPLTGGQILEKTGYAPGVVKNPRDILDSQGVKEELKNYGFDPEKAKEVVAEILIAGENDSVKLKAADMIFKVHSTYAPEKSINLNVNVEPSDRIRELANRLKQLPPL
jgi:hypothetical protein